MSRIRIIAALPALLTLAGATRAQGQLPAAGNGLADAAAVSTAETLEAEAASYFPTKRRYKQAAKLLLRAASLRDATDVKGIEDLLRAGQLSYYVGDMATARRAIEQAGERALRAGYPGRAANAFLDAGYLALARKDRNSARRFFVDAWRLAQSPHLTESERIAIAGRLAVIGNGATPLAIVR